MPNASELIDNLHPLEIKTILSFKSVSEQYASEIAERAGLREDRLRTALEWLQLKEVLLVTDEITTEFVTLNEAGNIFAEKKILEMRILDIFKNKKEIPIMEIAKELGEEHKEVNIANANLKKENIVEIKKGGLVSVVSGADTSGFEKIQQLIEKVAELKTGEKKDFNEQSWQIIEQFSRKRGKSKGYFRKATNVNKKFALSETGKELLTLIINKGVTGEEVSQLTPEMLKDGSWKTTSFREYNIDQSFSRVVVGKKSPYRTFLDFVKRKLISLGFTEMKGPIVESEFWNMDALYMPQFHPARNIHDVYYVKHPEYCNEIKEPNYTNVGNVHTNGGNIGSKGWRYDFDKQRTKRMVLRSQGTALSARKLSELPDIPGKYFGMARCFRYDDVDRTHAPDFFQVEGIVLGDEINFRHLLGLLKLFAMEVAKTKEMMFVPAYFPFTEPSVEIHMKHKDLGWIELGGAGIFRPEVTKPQGIDVPVIAWGLGLDRMAMVALEIEDIRDLFSADLDMIRAKKVKQIM